MVSAWRLRRVARIEAGVLRYHIFDHQRDQAKRLAGTFETSIFDRLKEPETIIDEQRHADAEQLADEAETARDSEAIAIAFTDAVTRDDILGKLSRYEVAIERSLYRALHELQRLQAARQGRAVAPPAVVDVELATDPR